MIPRFEVVEAKRHHCGIIARTLRAEHRRAVERAGANVHFEIRSCFDQSTFRRSWMIDGQLAALGGVIAPLGAASGVVWLALSEDATRYPKAIVREARRQLAEILVARPVLTSHVLTDDPAGLRLALSFGFNMKHPLPFGDRELLAQVELHPYAHQRRVIRQGAVAAPFIIYTAGRSRTAWLSEFLTYGRSACHNEIAVKFRATDEVARFFASDWVGTAETAVAPGWRLVNAACPKIRTVVVRRDETAIIDSFRKLYADSDLRLDEGRLINVVRYEQRCLEQISNRRDTLTVDFEALEGMDACRDVFEHCLPYEFDEAWWRRMAARNVQTPLKELVGYYREHADAVESFKRESRAALRKLVRSGELSKNGGGPNAER